MPLIFQIVKYLFILVIAVFLFLVFIKNSYFYGGISLSLILTFLGSYFLLSRKIKNWKKNLYYSLLPFLLVASGIFYLVFVEILIVKVVIILSLVLLLFTYCKEILKESFTVPLVIAEKPRQFFLLLAVIIIFFLFSGLFGLNDFLSVSVIFLILPGGILILVLTTYLIFQEDKLGLSKLNIFLIMAAIMMELFWAISILPLVFYLKGLIISLCYLLILQFLLISRLGEGFKKVIRIYLIIIFLLLAVLLVTSRWF